MLEHKIQNLRRTSGGCHRSETTAILQLQQDQRLRLSSDRHDLKRDCTVMPSRMILGRGRGAHRELCQFKA